VQHGQVKGHYRSIKTVFSSISIDFQNRRRDVDSEVDTAPQDELFNMRLGVH
jgi:hypothetical protein